MEEKKKAPIILVLDDQSLNKISKHEELKEIINSAIRLDTKTCYYVSAKGEIH